MRCVLFLFAGGVDQREALEEEDGEDAGHEVEQDAAEEGEAEGAEEGDAGGVVWRPEVCRWLRERGGERAGGDGDGDVVGFVVAELERPWRLWRGSWWSGRWRGGRRTRGCRRGVARWRWSAALLMTGRGRRGRTRRPAVACRCGG